MTDMTEQEFNKYFYDFLYSGYYDTSVTYKLKKILIYALKNNLTINQKVIILLNFSDIIRNVSDCTRFEIDSNDINNIGFFIKFKNGEIPAFREKIIKQLECIAQQISKIKLEYYEFFRLAKNPLIFDESIYSIISSHKNDDIVYDIIILLTYTSDIKLIEKYVELFKDVNIEYRKLVLEFIKPSSSIYFNLDFYKKIVESDLSLKYPVYGAQQNVLKYIRGEIDGIPESDMREMKKIVEERHTEYRNELLKLDHYLSGKVEYDYDWNEIHEKEIAFFLLYSTYYSGYHIDNHNAGDPGRYYYNIQFDKANYYFLKKLEYYFFKYMEDIKDIYLLPNNYEKIKQLIDIKQTIIDNIPEVIDARREVKVDGAYLKHCRQTGPDTYVVRYNAFYYRTQSIPSNYTTEFSKADMRIIAIDLRDKEFKQMDLILRKLIFSQKNNLSYNQEYVIAQLLNAFKQKNKTFEELVRHENGKVQYDEETGTIFGLVDIINMKCEDNSDKIFAEQVNKEVKIYNRKH